MSSIEKRGIDKRELVDELAGAIYKNQEWHQSMLKGFDVNEERSRILCEIILNDDIKGQENLREQIFRYGSLVKQEDLLARQIFLGLVQQLEG